MTTPSPATKTLQRIEDMQAKKNQALEKVSTTQKKAEADLKAIEQTIWKAAADLDASGYEKAKKEKDKISLILEMCKDKLAEIRKKQAISEEESDKVIDELLQYEELLEKNFLEAIESPLDELRTILADYKASVIETEDVIKRWTNEVHANYRNATSAYKRESKRREIPVPVRYLYFDGCPEAVRLGKYLSKEDLI